MQHVPGQKSQVHLEPVLGSLRELQAVPDPVCIRFGIQGQTRVSSSGQARSRLANPLVVSNYGNANGPVTEAR